MKPQFANVTKCPHCQMMAFAPFAQNNDLLASAMNVEPVVNPFAAIEMGGLHLPVFFKICGQCGFVGMFSRNIVNS